MIRACVLRAPGTNCDVETAYAFEAAGASAERVHLFRLLESPELLRDFQILCVPGGFSYGDDIGAGVIFSRQLRGQLRETIGEFLTGDRLALGICNGFQVLLKAGVLPDAGVLQEAGSQVPASVMAGTEAAAAGSTEPASGGNSQQATLTWNENGRYTASWVRLATAGSNSVFLRGIDEIELPIAHAEGRFVSNDPQAVARWKEAGQLACRYIPWQQNGAEQETLHPTANPNGSLEDIAGLSDPTGRVLGLMPHPERFLFATQHPEWTRRQLSGEGAGMQLFRNAVEYFG